MKIIVLDTETIGLEKQFIYDLGYIIYDTETKLVIKQKDYIISQVFNNKPLMATSYYAEKLPMYYERLKTKYAKKVGWGNACRYLKNDIEKYNITKVFAYNSRFDYSAFKFCCSYYGVANPLELLNYKDNDIMALIKPITNTENYKNFCFENGFLTKHKTPRPQQKAETLYAYLTNNVDYKEEHTALEDSKIELYILLQCEMA